MSGAGIWKTRILRPRFLGSVVLLATLVILIVFAIRPLRVNYYLGKGRRALADAKNVEALGDFRAARDIDPKNPETGFWLARACRKTGDLAGVRKYLEEARQLGYRDEKRLEQEWWLVLAESGHLKEAEQHLPEMLINSGDDGSEICDAFSKGYCLSLRFPEARKLLDAWSTEYPKDYRPYLRRAQMYAGDERWALAVGELLEAQKRAPDEIAVQRELGRCLYKNKELEEAVRQLQAVLRHEPSDVAALTVLAEIAFDRKDYKNAIGYLEQVIAARPQDFPARLLLAKVYLAMGDPSRAVTLAESLISEWPEDLSAQYTLAQSLRASNRPEEAQRHFVIHSELQKNLTRIETLSREIKKKPSDPQLRFELGLLVLRHVSRPEGVAWLESVFQFAPAHPEAHQALADYYSKIGNPTLAAQHRQQANTNISSASPSLPGDRP
jgi:tetratricopeptide (TPR) repeat protein